MIKGRTASLTTACVLLFAGCGSTGSDGVEGESAFPLVPTGHTSTTSPAEFVPVATSTSLPAAPLVSAPPVDVSLADLDSLPIVDATTSDGDQLAEFFRSGQVARIRYPGMETFPNRCLPISYGGDVSWEPPEVPIGDADHSIDPSELVANYEAARLLLQATPSQLQALGAERARQCEGYTDGPAADLESIRESLEAPLPTPSTTIGR